MYRRIGIVISSSDPASVNICKNIEEIFGNDISFGEINFDLLYHDEKGIFDDFDASGYDLIFFASTHCSEKKMNSLTVHVAGNFSEARFGGDAKELCIAPADIIRNAYFSIKKNYSLVKENNPSWSRDYEITIEATHHGPNLKDVPSLFIEIGSDEDSWNDTFAGEVIARSIIDSVITLNKMPKGPVCIGIGGPHYASNFVKMIEDSDACVGHIVAKYALSALDSRMITQLINKTTPKFDYFAVDYKGLGQDKQKIKDLLEKYPWKKIDDFRK